VWVIGIGGFGSEGWLLAGFELKGAHVAGDAVAAAGDALVVKTNGQSRAAVGLAVGDKELSEFVAQELVGHSAATGTAVKPGIVRAAGHPQDHTQIADRILVLLAHQLNQGIPPGGRSDSMPMAFFKISWWSLSRVFSLRRRISSSCSLSGGK